MRQGLDGLGAFARFTNLLRILPLILIFRAGAPAADPEFHIPFEKYKLSNGLRVILARDASIPVTAVYMLYDVGARSEEKGRTGFAHLFEHMMFEGSANVKRGDYFRLVQANGGEVNGSTHLDYTEFIDVLPSNKLALALWLESDRMRSLAITEENLKNQKETIQQEKRRNYETQPYRGILADKWPPLIFADFHDAHSVIGAVDDLNSATVDDVAKFFKTYYAPNNAVMVISGDFTAAETKKTIDRYFGDIPSQPPPQRPKISEPPRAEGRYLAAPDEHARVPGLVVGWPAPKRHSPDWYALYMLDAVLTAGKGSRLEMELVKGRQSALQIDANLGWPAASPQDYKDPGYYAMMILHKPAFTGKEVADQLQQAIDSVGAIGLDSSGMKRIREVTKLSRANLSQTPLQRAKILGISELLDGDAGLAERDYPNLIAVTSEQVQSVATKYLTAGRRDLLEIKPATGAAK